MKAIFRTTAILFSTLIFSGAVFAQSVGQPQDQSAAPSAATESAVQPVQTQAVQPAAAQPAQMGLVPETAPVAAKPADEATPGTTLTLSPSIMIKPVAADKIGKYGMFLGLEPKLDFNADFVTATKKKINLDLAYTFTYKQYLNQQYERYFEHILEAVGSHDITSKLSASVYAKGDVVLYYSQLNSSQNENAIESLTSISYKLTPAFKVGMGYYLLFFYDPNAMIGYDQIDSLTNPISDSTDIIKGMSGLYSGTNGYTSYLDPTGSSGGESFKFFLQGINLNGTYKFSKETSLTTKFYYYPFTSSNLDAQEYRGFQTYLVLTQALWKDASIILDYRFRYQNFPTVFSALENTKIALRHRMYVTIDQKINDMVTIEGFYKYETSSSNTSVQNYLHEMYLGVNLSF